MSKSNYDIVKTFYEAVGRGEFASATDVFSDDLVWVEPPFPGHEGGVFEGKAISSPTCWGASSEPGSI